MFGLGKKPPEIDAAGAMFNLVREQWPDVEEATTIAVVLLLLGDTEFYPIAPEFKGKAVGQRVIAIAMYASISKSGVNHLGKAGAVKLFQAAADYAGKRGEASFFADMRKSLRIG
ncbi:MAG TPA: hypothetical protein VIJ52_03160 [Pseudolabrys sp.]